jgi:hypothetical protein
MHQSDVAPLNTEALWLEALPILQVLWPELRAEAYVVIAEDSEGMAAGELVRPLPLPGLWSA